MDSTTQKITFRDKSTQVIEDVSGIREDGTYTIIACAGKAVLRVPSKDVLSIAVADLPERQYPEKSPVTIGRATGRRVPTSSTRRSAELPQW